MAAATARGTSDACIFALPSPLCVRRSRKRATCARYRTVQSGPAAAQMRPRSVTTGEGRGHEGPHGTNTPSTADELQPASSAGVNFGETLGADPVRGVYDAVLRGGMLMGAAARMWAGRSAVTTVQYDGITHDFRMLNLLSGTLAASSAVAQAILILRGRAARHHGSAPGRDQLFAGEVRRELAA